MVAPLPPLPPELRAAVSARSLPDESALRNMRRALAALGGGQSDSADGDDDASSPSAPSLVASLSAPALRHEARLWERMMYKSASQHRRSVHFQRMRGVTRRLRVLLALDVAGSAAALRDALDAGVSAGARAAALATPAVAAGAHAIWKLPPRALWHDLARRLRATADVAAEADDDLLAAAAALAGQLARQYFMPFALIALAAVARARLAVHALILDVVAAYNVLAPLLNAGVMPPPGLPGAAPEVDSLRCEWRPVTPPPPSPGAATPPPPPSAPSGRTPKRPVARADAAGVAPAGIIEDEDWNWRLLTPAKRDDDASGSPRATGISRRARDGAQGEDLGAAVPRRVRGIAATVDRGGGGGSEGSRRDDAARPTYATTGSGLGLGLGGGARARAEEEPARAAGSNAEKADEAAETRERKEARPAPPAFDFDALAAGVAPKAGVAGGSGGSEGGKKRRRKSSGGEKDGGGPAAEGPALETKAKKKKKKNKTAGGDADPREKPLSAMEKAMALLTGGSS